VRLPREMGGRRYTLSAATLDAPQVRLNGQELALGADDRLPDLLGDATVSDVLEFAPATLSFVAFPKADNRSCK